MRDAYKFFVLLSIQYSQTHPQRQLSNTNTHKWLIGISLGS